MGSATSGGLGLDTADQRPEAEISGRMPAHAATGTQVCSTIHVQAW